MRKLLVLPILLLTACAAPPHVAPSIARVPTTSTTTIAPPTTTAVPPPTTTTTAHTHAPRPTLCPQPIVDLIHKHFDEFGVGVADWFVGIVWRESNCQPDAWNRASGCYGLTQQALPVHSGRYTVRGWDWKTSWMDADKNLTIAADLYREQGARPWRL